MFRLTATVVALTLFAVFGMGDEQPARKSGGSLSRAQQLKAIQADFEAAREEVFGAIRAGKVKAREDGSYQELGDLAKRFAKRTREFITAEPKDEVALDAILFSIRQLWADENDRSLHERFSLIEFSSWASRFARC